MDHLCSADDRKARWYSKVTPRFIPVVTAKEPQHLLLDTKEVCMSVPFTWFEKANALPSSLHDILQASLHNDGFVVVSGVLRDDECQTVLDLAWDWMEAASRAERRLQAQESRAPIIRHDLESLRSGIFPTSLEGGILPFYGSGHSQAAWNVRSHPGIHKIFEVLYETDDLISSLDGTVFWHSYQAITDSGWFHVDQNPRDKPESCSYQGLLNLIPVTPVTGGNVLVRGSHHLFPRHYVNNPDANCRDFYNNRLDELNGDDWMEIDPNDSKAINSNKVISLMLQPGDFFAVGLSNCSLFSPPSATTPSMPPQLVRAATLITMMPTSWANPDVLEKRKDAVKQQRTLSHWANQVQLETARVQYIREWQTKANKLILCDWDDLNPYQQSLVIGTNKRNSSNT